jgi:2-hydroxychromene-2-carboxylate isomerase
MTPEITFYFDFVSPYSYLASTQLPHIASATNAVIDWRPMLLGEVFRATGNRPPGEVVAKGLYLWRDLIRFAERYGVELRLNPHFPVDTQSLMRAATGMKMFRPEELLFFVESVFHAMWVEAKDIADPEVFADVMFSVGLDPAEVNAWVSDPAIEEALDIETEGAVARGVFGAPTFFVGDEMFFGQDRLDFVREASRLAAISQCGVGAGAAVGRGGGGSF